MSVEPADTASNSGHCSHPSTPEPSAPSRDDDPDPSQLIKPHIPNGPHTLTSEEHAGQPKSCCEALWQVRASTMQAAHDMAVEQKELLEQQLLTLRRQVEELLLDRVGLEKQVLEAQLKQQPAEEAKELLSGGSSSHRRLPGSLLTHGAIAFSLHDWERVQLKAHKAERALELERGVSAALRRLAESQRAAAAAGSHAAQLSDQLHAQLAAAQQELLGRTRDAQHLQQALLLSDETVRRLRRQLTALLQIEPELGHRQRASSSSHSQGQAHVSPSIPNTPRHSHNQGHGQLTGSSQSHASEGPAAHTTSSPTTPLKQQQQGQQGQRQAVQGHSSYQAGQSWAGPVSPHSTAGTGQAPAVVSSQAPGSSGGAPPPAPASFPSPSPRPHTGRGSSLLEHSPEVLQALRASREQANAADAAALHLQQQLAAVLATAERLMHENAELAARLNAQTNLLAHIRSECAHKDAALARALHQLSAAGLPPPPAPTDRPHRQDALSPRPAQGNDKAAHNTAPGAGSAANELVEGLNESQWKLVMVTQEVAGLEQRLASVRARGVQGLNPVPVAQPHQPLHMDASLPGQAEEEVVGRQQEGSFIGQGAAGMAGQEQQCRVKPAIPDGTPAGEGVGVGRVDPGWVAEPPAAAGGPSSGVSGAGEVGGVRWQLQWQQVPGLHLPAEQLRARITLLAQRMLQLEELLEAEEEAQQQVQQQQLVEGQCQQQQVQQLQQLQGQQQAALPGGSKQVSAAAGQQLEGGPSGAAGGVNAGGGPVQPPPGLQEGGPGVPWTVVPGPLLITAASSTPGQGAAAAAGPGGVPLTAALDSWQQPQPQPQLAASATQPQGAQLAGPPLQLGLLPRARAGVGDGGGGVAGLPWEVMDCSALAAELAGARATPPPPTPTPPSVNATTALPPAPAPPPATSTATPIPTLAPLPNPITTATAGLRSEQVWEASQPQVEGQPAGAAAACPAPPPPAATCSAAHAADQPQAMPHQLPGPGSGHSRWDHAGPAAPSAGARAAGGSQGGQSQLPGAATLPEATSLPLSVTVASAGTAPALLPPGLPLSASSAPLPARLQPPAVSEDLSLLFERSQAASASASRPGVWGWLMGRQ